MAGGALTANCLRRDQPLWIAAILADPAPHDRKSYPGGAPSSGATVIKAFNAMYASYLEADPNHAEGRQVVFFAADDTSAINDFSELVGRIGFAPVLVGGLHDGGRLMQLGTVLSALHVIKQG